MGKKSRSGAGRRQSAGGALARTPLPSASTASLQPGFLSAYGLPISLVAFALALSIFSVRSDDLFMYLAAGEAILSSGSIPSIDPFLFSIQNAPWQITHEWLAYIPIYLTFKYFGWNGLIILKCIPIVLAALTPLALARRLKTSAVVAALLAFLACISACDRFIERTSIISDCFTAIALALIILQRAQVLRAVWALPLLFLLWTNLHPGVLVGLVLVIAALLASFIDGTESPQRLRISLVLAIVAACINPEGVQGVLYPILKTTNENESVVREFYDEWKPTLSPQYLASLEVQVFLVLLVTVGGILLRRILAESGARRATLARFSFEIFAFAAVAYHGLSAIRFLPTGAFGIATLGAALTLRRDSTAVPLMIMGLRAESCTTLWLLVSTAYVAMFGYSPLSGPRTLGFGFNPLYYPVRAAALADEIGLSTNVFNQHEFGNYLAWTWRPRRKVFFHGFVDDAVFYRDNYIAVTKSKEDFDRIVDNFSIGAFLLEGRTLSSPQLPLVYRELTTRLDWALVYRDRTSALFLRRIPGNDQAFARLQALSAQAPAPRP